MSVSVRRKRGRPRRDEPREINDFDLALIQEFQRRPAFYDRTHPQYRNREILEPLWADMASKLGYNVSLIKDRMQQLRNRYNLEKRRVEALQEQFDDQEVNSQWSLYEHLTFLCDHIKSRRSYSASQNQQTTFRQLKQSAASNSSEADDNEDSQPFTINAASVEQPQQQQQPQLHQPTIAIANEFRAKTEVSVHHNSTAVATDSASPLPPPPTTPPHKQLRARHLLDGNGMVTSKGIDKFKAFGQFLTSSLIEMNEEDALLLVERFTSELVRSLRAESKVKQFQESEDSVVTTNMDS